MTNIKKFKTHIFPQLLADVTEKYELHVNKNCQSDGNCHNN